MRSLLFWGALPFLWPQARRVRRTAPRFADAAGARQGRAGSGEPSVALLALGDSIIAGVGASTLERALVGQTASSLARLLDTGVAWRAEGKTGINTRNALLHQVPAVAQPAADYIVISLGVNDVTGLRRRRDYRRDLEGVIDGLTAHHEHAVIALSGLPPMHHFPLLPQPMRAVMGVRARQFDDIVHEVAAGRSGLVHVPIVFDPSPEAFSQDGFHPSESGYQAYGEAVAQALAAESSSHDRTAQQE